MSITRLYTGDDGESHIEELDLDSHPELKSLQKVEGIWLQKWESYELPFTQEPARRWMVVLSGSLEIGLGDGSKHVYKTGDIRLVEDTTGHGHTFRLLEPTTFLVIETVPDHGPWEH